MARAESVKEKEVATTKMPVRNGLHKFNFSSNWHHKNQNKKSYIKALQLRE